jgi:hypothetical protein
MGQVGGQGEREAAAAADFGAALQAGAGEVAARWRRRVFDGDLERATEQTALLDGVAEPLLVEVGRELARGTVEAAAPWVRCGGLLRVSAARGKAGLDGEFDLLEDGAVELAQRCNAPAAVRRQLQLLLEAARRLAHGELAHVLDPACPRPQPPFGGVVVELYEPRPRLH